MPEENARRGELLELIEAFQWFEPIDPELVPVDSLLREFIGGGSLSTIERRRESWGGSPQARGPGHAVPEKKCGVMFDV